MSTHTLVHAPVGGPLLTRTFKILLGLVFLGAVAGAWRMLFGLGAVANINDGYPWGIWIAFDVVVGTALGCGGYAVALLVYILNKGEYHPLVRPAVLTSLLGYGLAVIAVVLDLGRFWELWKVPVYFWRWTGSPQLEVALCVMTYVAVLLVEMSPALFERWRSAKDSTLRGWGEKGLKLVNRGLVWILALGILLPTMHQSSLGTMMLLTGPKLHGLWFTAWLPFLFLVSCILMGYGIVVLEATYASRAFGRPSETPMLARLSKVAMGVALFFVIARVGLVAFGGKLGLLASGMGAWFLVEMILHLAPAWILFSEERRNNPMWQIRAGMLLVLAGTVYRIDTYLVAFQPGAHWSYFPSVPELLITFGIVAAEILIYIWAVKRFPILSGAGAAPARA